MEYKARHRDPDRRERSKTFLRKIDAEEFARSVETDIRRGDYLDPAAGKQAGEFDDFKVDFKREGALRELGKSARKHYLYLKTMGQT